MLGDNNMLYYIKRKFQLFSNDLQSFKMLHAISSLKGDYILLYKKEISIIS